MQDALTSGRANIVLNPASSAVKRTAAPVGRVTAVDWFKGFAIGSMCMLHYATTVLGAFKLGIHSTSLQAFPLLDGFLQLHNGAFFLLSAFGNWFSIRRGMNRAETKNPEQPDYSPVLKTILTRGTLIIGLGMFATFIFNHGIFDSLIGWGDGGGIPAGQLENILARSFTNSWKNALLSPMVTPYIGFSVMIGGLVAFKVELKYGPATSRQKTKAMGIAWLSVFIVGFMFRKLLDHATCGSTFSQCVGGQKCSTWNISELDAARIVLPTKCYTTHSPLLDFSDVVGWAGPSLHGPDNISCPESVKVADLQCPHGALDSVSGEWVDTADAQSYLRAINAGCLRGYPSSLSDTSFAHITDLDRGYQCCSTANREDASSPTAEEKSNPKLECCLLTPWYGPPHGSGGALGASLADRTTMAQKFVQLLTWPLVGTYGFFCYGAETIAGYLIAMHVQQDGWTPKLFQTIFSVAFVCMALAGPADWWLFFQDGNESVQQASPINRCYIIATELIAFGVICGVIEGRRHNGIFGCCSICRCCNEKGCCGVSSDQKWKGIGGAERFKKTALYRFYKRFGMISFTVYHTEGCIRNFVSFVVGAVGGRAPPFCVGGYPKDSECYQAAHECDSPSSVEICQKCKDGAQIRPGYDQGVTSTVFIGCAYVGIGIFFWGITLWQWEKYGFVGSFEWGMQKILSASRGSKSDVLSAKTHDEKPFVAGQKGDGAYGGNEIGEGREDISFGDMWPCRYCTACGNGTSGTRLDNIAMELVEDEAAETF